MIRRTSQNSAFKRCRDSSSELTIIRLKQRPRQGRAHRILPRGYIALYAITHPGATRLAAAISGDGWTGSYASYLTMVVEDQGLKESALEHYGKQYAADLSGLTKLNGLSTSQHSTPIE